MATWFSLVDSSTGEFSRWWVVRAWFAQTFPWCCDLDWVASFHRFPCSLFFPAAMAEHFPLTQAFLSCFSVFILPTLNEISETVIKIFYLLLSYWYKYNLLWGRKFFRNLLDIVKPQMLSTRLHIVPSIFSYNYSANISFTYYSFGVSCHVNFPLHLTNLIMFY